MNYILPGKANFEKKHSGMLIMTADDGKLYERVFFTYLFPFSYPGSYISVSYITDTAPEEIGIIKEIHGFSVEQRKLIESEIKSRYFIPEITDIKKILVVSGIYECNVVTDRGEKTFLLTNLGENVYSKDDGNIIITDMEHCRYRIVSVKRLPVKAQWEFDKILI
jgi:hypothetical protein